MHRPLLSHFQAMTAPPARGVLHIFAGHHGGVPMRALLAAIVAGLVTEIMQTLPSDEREAGTWLAGFCWAFLIFIALLLLVTLGWATSHGVAL